MDGITGLSGRGRGGIGTTIDTSVVTLSYTGIGCCISGSSIGSATETISG